MWKFEKKSTIFSFYFWKKKFVSTFASFSWYLDLRLVKRLVVVRQSIFFLYLHFPKKESAQRNVQLSQPSFLSRQCVFSRAMWHESSTPIKYLNLLRREPSVILLFLPRCEWLWQEVHKVGRPPLVCLWRLPR